jgi:hypothetical protein
MADVEDEAALGGRLTEAAPECDAVNHNGQSIRSSGDWACSLGLATELVVAAARVDLAPESEVVEMEGAWLEAIFMSRAMSHVQLQLTPNHHHGKTTQRHVMTRRRLH